MAGGAYLLGASGERHVDGEYVRLGRGEERTSDGGCGKEGGNLHEGGTMRDEGGNLGVSEEEKEGEGGVPHGDIGLDHRPIISIIGRGTGGGGGRSHRSRGESQRRGLE